jgi:hypothetical protein
MTRCNNIMAGGRYFYKVGVVGVKVGYIEGK